MDVTKKRSRLNLQAIANLAELADYTYAFTIRAVARLGVPDELADGPRHVDAIAAATGSHAPALLRAMRALAAKGIFDEEPEQTFSLTPMGELLREDHPLSMKSFFRLEPDVRALAALEHCVRTGSPSFNAVFGKEYFEWLAEHQDVRAQFDASQEALNRLELLALLRAYPWAEVARIVDIGGNDGAFVSALLTRHRRMSGAVFDLPEVVDAAAKRLSEAGVADRATVVAGSIFDPVAIPARADVYVIKRVLVGFSDEQVVDALRCVAAAMSPDSRLLVMEPMRTAVDQIGTSLDVLMLALGAGRVRTPGEFSELMCLAGVVTTRTIDAGLLTIVEGATSAGP